MIENHFIPRDINNKYYKNNIHASVVRLLILVPLAYFLQFLYTPDIGNLDMIEKIYDKHYQPGGN